MGAYTGALARAAHFGRYTPVRGYDPSHTDGRNDPDLFGHEPTPPSGQVGDVWLPADATGHSAMADEPIHHWTDLYPPVPSNVPGDVALQEWQQRTLANHSREHYRPDTARGYTHATIGKSIEYSRGRAPWVAGEDVPDQVSYLIYGHRGTNAYDRLNPVTDVYGADEGRYRLGGLFTRFAAYDQNARNGQDAQLRAYTPLTPAFPVDKERIEGTQPVIPNSRGTATWITNAFQRPRSFTTPAESEGTDFALVESTADAVSDFREDGRL